MFEKIKKFIHSKILRKHYWRTGKCKGCGECCSHIYVKHFRHVLKDEKEFERLQYIHSFYSGLKVIGKDELGLIFECTHLDKETKRCKIHYRRPGICRRYPQEELFSMGGTLSDKCGYKMEPIVSFKEVLNKIEKKQNKKIVR
jgi:Fe-S-cluster containining protein